MRNSPSVPDLAALLVFDYVFHVRRAHVPALREAAVWSALYVGIAVAFGITFSLIARGEASTGTH